MRVTVVGCGGGGGGCVVKKREYDESEACINIHASGNPAHTHADALNHHLLCRPPPIIYGMNGCRRWDVIFEL